MLSRAPQTTASWSSSLSVSPRAPPRGTCIPGGQTHFARRGRRTCTGRPKLHMRVNRFILRRKTAKRSPRKPHRSPCRRPKLTHCVRSARRQAATTDDVNTRRVQRIIIVQVVSCTHRLLKLFKCSSQLIKIHKHSSSRIMGALHRRTAYSTHTRVNGVELDARTGACS